MTDNATTDAEIQFVEESAQTLIDNVRTVVVGNDEAIEHVVTTLLSGGHVLLEDVPGVGKTMLAKAVARSFDGEFSRIQFTPDLLPTDVTGVNVYNRDRAAFEFRSGPVFGDIVLADEIDRASPKTQSALLEAMEEGQVTVDGERHSLSEVFTVIATRNTVSESGSYDLPVAELDRFTKRLELGYPSEAAEVEVLGRALGEHPVDGLDPVLSRAELRRGRDIVDRVTVSAELREYVTRLLRYTREHAELGVSPRGGIALLQVAQARAALDGRGYVVPADIATELPAVFHHRLRQSVTDTDRFIEDVQESVPIECD